MRFPNLTPKKNFHTEVREAHRVLMVLKDMPSLAHSHPSHVNEITGMIVNSAMKVHSLLGPGLLESAYHACLAHELSEHEASKQQPKSACRWTMTATSSNSGIVWIWS
jgi:hypothetical protein